MPKINITFFSLSQTYLEEDIPKWREVREEMEGQVEQLIKLCDPVPPDELNEMVHDCITRCERAEHKLRHTLHSKQVSIFFFSYFATIVGIFQIIKS